MGTVVRTVCRIANLVFHFCFFLFPLLVILFGFIESMRKIDVHYERNVGIRTKNILQFILYLRSVNKRGEVKKKKKNRNFQHGTRNIRKFIAKRDFNVIAIYFSLYFKNTR